MNKFKLVKKILSEIFLFENTVPVPILYLGQSKKEAFMRCIDVRQLCAISQQTRTKTKSKEKIQKEKSTVERQAKSDNDIERHRQKQKDREE